MIEAMREGVIAYPPPPPPPLAGADAKRHVSLPPQLLRASPHVALVTSRKMHQPARTFKAALFASTLRSRLIRPPTLLSQICSASPSPEEILCPPLRPYLVADSSSLSAEAKMPTISDETLRCQIAQNVDFDTKTTAT
ncbi:hypothetical protein GOP47_0024872 [Adiantum capillus-veneris]|uniref:Uncharacterized protein n=1 Tax=Adiantum capillus-veneris TaxID=13818 RepID=A0A9D4U324_ADICA|nr:hypothetical protein GOP47_0024872 [Adiantum capillus-veneris]